MRSEVLTQAGVGRVRNADSFLCDVPGQCFAVADGVGCAEEAPASSRLAVAAATRILGNSVMTGNAPLPSRAK